MAEVSFNVASEGFGLREADYMGMSGPAVEWRRFNKKGILIETCSGCGHKMSPVRDVCDECGRIANPGKDVQRVIGSAVGRYSIYREGLIRDRID